ncbi:YidH family protein [Enemella dayhoffiae]|uniref:YidH family protein n=1 Tax=Enemella dayhoffiae TaxID=2016507 RepID=UPI001E438F7F|nr:DUF202 domain-containing protein [Enemella dayhoffiae]
MPTPDERSALARRLLPGGKEPDARFTLANERTFLAWIRTSLALLGGGVALEAFAANLFHPGLRRAASLMLVVVGLVMAGAAIIRWVRVERAMRESRPLPVPTLVPVLGVGVALAAAVLLFLIAGGR